MEKKVQVIFGVLLSALVALLALLAVSIVQAQQLERVKAERASYQRLLNPTPQ
jgi:cytochrome c-type biogenesis protein CcmH/NrfG